jgi:hypothetical protein
MYQLNNSIKVNRKEDNDTIGYVSANNDHWIALTLFGYPIESCTSEREAVRIVHEKGLDFLADGWTYFDPAMFEWFECKIQEASENQVSILITDPTHPDAFRKLVLRSASIDRLKR